MTFFFDTDIALYIQPLSQSSRKAIFPGCVCVRACVRTCVLPGAQFFRAIVRYISSFCCCFWSVLFVFFVVVVLFCFAVCFFQKCGTGHLNSLSENQLASNYD